MQVELSRGTFKRLVQLYLLSLVLLVASLAYESFGAEWAPFAEKFDALQSQHSGETSEDAIIPVAILCLVALVGHLVSSVALLGFRRWARTGFWLSVVLGLLFGLVPEFYPYWYSFLTSWITFIGSALFGMILLLAYSREQGGEWFEGRQATSSENN